MQEQTNAQNELFPRFPRAIEQPIFWGPQGKLRVAQGHKAIVDPDTGRVFSIVSKDYKVISHEQAINQIESALSKHEDLRKYNSTIDYYNGGGRMRCTFTFPEVSIAIRPGDLVNLQLHLFNSYDVTWPFIVILGAFRLVCSNGLVVGNKILHIKKRHVYELDDLHISKNITTATKRFVKQTKQWVDLADVPLTPTTYTKVMESMRFGKGATEVIQQKISDDASGYNNEDFPVISLWIFYNVLTWYITHRAVSLNHTVEMESRLRWFWYSKIDPPGGQTAT